MRERKVLVRLSLNGVDREGEAEPRTLLSDFIRHELDATGTHVGCEHGVCGACTILLDSVPVRSCLLLAVQASGAAVTTVESLAQGERLHPLQEAFVACHGLQCGFCTPGILMSVLGEARRGRSLEQVVARVLPGHLCRCTGYVNIRAAVRQAWPHVAASG